MGLHEIKLLLASSPARVYRCSTEGACDMSHAKRITGILLSLSAAALLARLAPAQQPNYDELAKRIIKTSATIKPSDVVVISGGKHNLALMEALAIEANKAGGMSTMFISTDKVDRSFNVDVPEKYLEQEPRFFGEWLKQVDVYIGLPSDEDRKAVIAGVAAGRFAKAAKAGQIIDDMLMNTPRLRGVFIGYPTKEEAAAHRMDFTAFSKMHWDAVNADYNQISARGKALQKALQGAKSVRITSPGGTDITFSIGDRTVFVDDGVMTPEKAKSKMLLGRIASLPGGNVFVAPIETSANGKVVVPKMNCRYDPMNGVSFEFKGGKLQNFKATQNGGCFVETMAPYPGPKDMFAQFSIGLNPAMKVVEQGGAYWPGAAAGLVRIGIGSNEMLGGANKTPGGFGFPLVSSTVTVDGKVVVKDGQLVM
jgi:aminopeptidase